MHIHGADCTDLIVKTSKALNNDAVAIMLLAVQRGNMKVSVQTAVER